MFYWFHHIILFHSWYCSKRQDDDTLWAIQHFYWRLLCGKKLRQLYCRIHEQKVSEFSFKVISWCLIRVYPDTAALGTGKSHIIQVQPGKNLFGAKRAAVIGIQVGGRGLTEVWYLPFEGEPTVSQRFVRVFYQRASLPRPHIWQHGLSKLCGATATNKHWARNSWNPKKLVLYTLALFSLIILVPLVFLAFKDPFKFVHICCQVENQFNCTYLEEQSRFAKYFHEVPMPMPWLYNYKTISLNYFLIQITRPSHPRLKILLITPDPIYGHTDLGPLMERQQTTKTGHTKCTIPEDWSFLVCSCSSSSSSCLCCFSRLKILITMYTLAARMTLALTVHI